jgi:hypothetical protein
MRLNTTCLEMAFELACSGKFADLALLERRLRDEGYRPPSWTAPLSGVRYARVGRCERRL